MGLGFIMINDFALEVCPESLNENLRPALATGLTPAQFETIKEQIRKLKKREK